MSGGKQKERQQTVTNQTQIPAWLEGPLQEGVAGAQAQYQQGRPDYYAGETYAKPSRLTMQSQRMTEDLAGYPDQAGVLDNYAGLMGGDYLYGGEGFNAALDAAQRDIEPRVASAFGRAGRHRSGLADAAIAQELGDVFAGQYGAERGRQMQGLSMAPMMESIRGLPAARLAQAGAQREAQREEQIADARARHEHAMYGPSADLDQYINRVTGVAPFGGQTSMQSNPQYSNQLAGVAGGALSGLGAASSLFPAAGPWGMAAGGLLGGLSGLF